MRIGRNRTATRAATFLLAVLASLAARGVHAEISPAAQAIVDHYVEATGGRAALDSEWALRVKGRVSEAAMTGRFETWTRVPSSMSETMSLGPLRMRAGSDSANAWETDHQSKAVRVLDGSEREYQYEEAYFQNEMWARSDQGGGVVAAGSRSYSNDAALLTLDVTPPIGRRRRLFFDDRTGLMDRMEGTRDQHAWRENIMEWRRMAGRVRPAVIEEGDPQDLARFMRVTVDSAWCNPKVDAARFAPPASSLGPIAWQRAKGHARIPFHYVRRQVLVKVSLNGMPAEDFLLDTGCSTTALTADCAARLQVVREGRGVAQGVGGESEFAFARLQSLRVGSPGGDGVTLKDLRVIVLGEEDPDIPPAMRFKFSGLLGADVLSRFVVRVDFDSAIVRLFDPASFQYAGSGRAVEMGSLGGIPTVSLTLGDCEGRFIVDVGNSFHLNVHGSAVRRCHLFDGDRDEIEVWGGGIGDAFMATVCRLKSVTFGGYTWSDPVVALSLTRQGMVGSVDYAGNIGTGVLERFVCTFDYARGVLWLEPGKRFEQRDRWSRTGVFFYLYDNTVYVANVAHGSPAWDAGLQFLDEVVTIDGKPANEMPQEVLSDLFEESPVGEVHELVFKRRDVRKVTSLTLRDIP